MTTYSLREAAKIQGDMSKQVRQAGMRALQSAAYRVVERVHGLIAAENPTPVDRGISRAGWRVVKVENGYAVVNDVPHTAFMEHGVPGASVKISRKMIDALTEWVLRKGIVGGAAGGRKRSATKSQRKAARDAAWAIAVSLKKSGIFKQGAGLKILERALKGIDRVIQGEFEREMASKR